MVSMFEELKSSQVYGREGGIREKLAMMSDFGSSRVRATTVQIFPLPL